ncbi:MAG: enoyl-CoA hydratase/isomerase family protein [Candidatus Methylomirabilia bacterium]
MKLERQDRVGILTIDTEHGNAINRELIREAHELMDEVEHDPMIRALVVASTHRSVFCPGVDLRSLITCSSTEMRAFFEAITGLVQRKFVFPKPEVYALNGHTIAGGCIMALTGDYRLMARGRFYIGVIEIDLGLTASAGMVEMLLYVLGGRSAERILYTGENYLPETALELGLVDEVVEGEMLMARALEHARVLGNRPQMAYGTVKRYARQAIVERMREVDAAHLDDLVALWFAEEAQQRLAATVQRLGKKAGVSPPS